MRILVLRLVVFLAAVGLPLVALIFAGQGPPPTLDVVALDNWSPVRTAGPSARLFASGLTSLAGLGAEPPPAWFTPDDQAALRRADVALRGNKLKEALGHMMVLSSQLEDRGKSLNDVLPMVVPSLASWMIANYFAPVVLGGLLVTLVILAFGPWLIRRFYDFLKLLMALLLGGAATAVAVSLCFALAGQRALVFALIEYLAAVTILLTAGNLIVYAVRRHRSRRLPARSVRSLPQRPAVNLPPALAPAPPPASERPER